MRTPAPCPYCGAAPGASGEPASDPVRQAVDALYREVALIRKIAETSTDQSEEIRMLRETVARLRGSSVAAAQYPSRGSHRPASASSLAPGSRTSSAA